MPEDKAPATQVESPPATPRPPAQDADDPRAVLQRLADALSKSHNARFLTEYLRVRRSLRA